MKVKWINELARDLPREERNLINFKEIPCKDMDIDCFALDGSIPFGSYQRCYAYAPD